MAHWKGQLLGLQALAGCRPARRLRVTVAGGAWFGEHGQDERVRQFVRENPQLDVDVLGHVHDVIPLIDRHDVLLHTSLLPEPSGRSWCRGWRGRGGGRGGPRRAVPPPANGRPARRDSREGARPGRVSAPFGDGRWHRLRR
jgi:hypothetical protein